MAMSRGKGLGRKRREHSIDELIELGMAKLMELDKEAREALEEGNRAAYLSTLRVLALFLKTNASLLAAKQKLMGREKATLDLAKILSSMKKVVLGLARRRRK